MKKILLIALLLSSIIHSQNIDVKVKGLANWRASLFSIKLNKSNFIQSVVSDNQGQFKIPGKNLHKGFYRLMFDNKRWLNFLYTGNDIKIETANSNLFGNLKVIRSEDNKAYYKFLRLNSDYKIWQKKLNDANLKYSSNDRNLAQIKKKYADVYHKYRSFIIKFSKSKKNSFISRYIRSAAEPKIKTDIKISDQRKYLKEHFWDNVDFSSAVLLNSDLYVNKTIEYLNLFNTKHFNKNLQNKEYQNAVDMILSKAKTNLRIYKQMTSYLIKGFKKLGLSNVIDYIVDNFVIRDDLCLDSKTENLIQMRIDQATKLKKTAKVPDIKLPDINGSTAELYKITANKILVLFYSSYCPHCKKFLPKLLKFYTGKGAGKFKIYGISLDTDKNKWQMYVKKNGYNWINVSDLKGWKSKVTYDFYVYATPTMFLVDKNFKIIDKPKTIEDLKNDLLIN